MNKSFLKAATSDLPNGGLFQGATVNKDEAARQTRNVFLKIFCALCEQPGNFSRAAPA
ncbi:hypothetical protein [Comamonas brasiliensis]|uniref:hypothetical protein n=1 Tax=Comamonas brasiliensis TaxID=1812482 RepID=UPI001B8C4E0C|nr:hypothetical protein [Comamonas sp. PE63]